MNTETIIARRNAATKSLRDDLRHYGFPHDAIDTNGTLVRADSGKWYVVRSGFDGHFVYFTISGESGARISALGVRNFLEDK